MSLLLLLTVLILILLSILVLLHYGKRKPPGPPHLPLLGSLPFLTTKRGLLDWVLDKQVTDHPMTTVWMGPTPFHIINCLQLAKQLFDREDFSDRKVPDWIVPLRFSDGALGIINNSGTRWSAQRRFSLKTLKDFGLGRRSMEDSIHAEVSEMIEKCFSSNGDIVLGADFNVPIINVLWQIVASARFDLENPKDAEMMNIVGEIFENGFKTDFFPLFLAKLLPSMSGLGRMTEVCHVLKEFLGDIIKDHENELDPNNPKDFIDVYLVEARKNSDVYNPSELINCIWDFFLAGTETSSTTLKWAILFLTKHQDVQDRCRREIHDLVGSSRVSAADLPSLSYVQATIAEVQRLSRVAPLSLPHVTTAPTRVGQFSFPEKSVFFTNISFIQTDPAHWDRPTDFWPDRFLSTDGRFSRSERLVPFGLGRRYCMGEQLARNEIFIFLADLLQQRRFLPPLHYAGPDPENFTSELTTIPGDFHLTVEKV